MGRSASQVGCLDDSADVGGQMSVNKLGGRDNEPGHPAGQSHALLTRRRIGVQGMNLGMLSDAAGQLLGKILVAKWRGGPHVIQVGWPE